MAYSLEELRTLKELNIKDFRSIGKDQLVEFVSSIPNMSKEVAMKCLEQVPYYMETAQSVANAYCDLCKEAINVDNLKFSEDEIRAHQTAIDLCAERINRKGTDIPHEEYIEIMGIMTEEAKAISKAVDKHLELKDKAMRYAGIVVSMVVATGASLLGVKVKNG